MTISAHQRITCIILILIISTGKPFTMFGQVEYQSRTSNVSISGTSTIHDWEMKSNHAQLNATFVLNEDQLTAISALHFTIESASLKSGHTLMDVNTYKALKTKIYNDISFILSSANVVAQSNNTYLLQCLGKLTIAGTTRETDLCVTCKWNPDDKSFLCTGTKKIKMTDYKVQPPVLMLGMIKTGDEIFINYNCRINRE